MPHLKLIGAPFRRSDVKSAGGVPLLATGAVKIADGITTTGSFIEDMMLDDQSLINR